MPTPGQCTVAVACRLITERLNSDDGGDSASRVMTTALLMALVIGLIATIGFQVNIPHGCRFDQPLALTAQTTLLIANVRSHVA